MDEDLSNRKSGKGDDFYTLSSQRTTDGVDELLALSPSMSASWILKRPWLSFAFDEDLKTNYNEFVSINQSWIFQSLLNILHLVICVPILMYIDREKDKDAGIVHAVLNVVGVILFCIVVLCGWLLALHFAFPDLHKHRTFQFLSRWKLHFQAGFAICFGLANAVYILHRLMDNRCVSTTSSCNVEKALRDVPNVNRVFNMFLPILCVTVLREWRVTVIAVVWILSLIVFAAGAVFLKSNSAPQSCIFYAFCSSMIILEVLQQRFRMFLTSKCLEDALRENEQLAAQEKASDLRHMIANVAHDLKTPLSSFMVGTEFIQQLVDELLCRPGGVDQQFPPKGNQSTRASNGCWQETLQSIRSSLHDISSTNAFMVMTINRCIDYTKASKGMKLTPKNETVDVLDAVSLPLSCMRNVQQKVSIALSPLPLGLCSHIVTDKQWLQENILCLLSNASKYSDGGTVTVRLSLAHSTLVCGEIQRSPATEAGSISVESCSNKSNTVRSFQSDDCSPSMQLLVEVLDEGIGVPDELMNSLFNPFKQTQKLAGGTGLGLYSLAKRVEALHGSCGVRKRSDGAVRGSVFWFAIPYRPDELYSTTVTADSSDNSGLKTMMQPLSSDNIIYDLEAPAPSFVHSPGGGGLHPSRRDWIIHTSTLSTSSDETVTNDHLRPCDAAASTSVYTKDDNPCPQAHPSVHPPAGRSNSFTTPRALSKVPSTLYSSTSSLTILLAEDSPTISKVQMSMLKKQGHCVTLVENGAMALRVFEDSLQAPSSAPSTNNASSLSSHAAVGESMTAHDKRSSTTSKSTVTSLPASTSPQAMPPVPPSPQCRARYDVILMDLQMPVMDGLEAIRRIRAFEQLHMTRLSAEDRDLYVRQRIIGVSANSDSETVREAFAMGVDAFLPKPFTQKALEDIVRSICN